MEANKNLIVGLFVGGTLLLFAIGLFLIGNSTQLFSKSFDVYADFSKVTGIQIGAKVRVAGMDAGAVTVIEVPPKPDARFRVRFRIVEKLHPLVRQDSVASIQTDGLLGNKFLEVAAGSEGSSRAESGSAIQSREPFDWGDLMDQLSNTVNSVNTVVMGVRDQSIVALERISDTAQSADNLIKTATPDIRSILESSNRIAANIHEISEGISEGRGTVGALFNDQDLAASVKHAVNDTRKTAQNLRDTTDSASKIVANIEDSNIVPEVQKTVKTLQQITQQMKNAVDKFESASGEGGVLENLQTTLADAHEAMSDLSDNTEALKHSFFFRGFFKGRGFYDLGSVSLPEYKSGKFGKGFQRHSIWLDSAALFIRNAKGVEALSASAKKRLDEAMAEILQFPRNGALMVEGYAGDGSASQQYLLARSRAAHVRTYITYQFHLRPAYVGIVAMGAVPPESGLVGPSLEGVRLVSFFKK